MNLQECFQEDCFENKDFYDNFFNKLEILFRLKSDFNIIYVDQREQIFKNNSKVRNEYFLEKENYYILTKKGAEYLNGNKYVPIPFYEGMIFIFMFNVIMKFL